MFKALPTKILFYRTLEMNNAGHDFCTSHHGILLYRTLEMNIICISKILAQDLFVFGYNVEAVFLPTVNY